MCQNGRSATSANHPADRSAKAAGGWLPQFSLFIRQCSHPTDGDYFPLCAVNRVVFHSATHTRTRLILPVTAFTGNRIIVRSSGRRTPRRMRTFRRHHPPASWDYSLQKGRLLLRRRILCLYLLPRVPHVHPWPLGSHPLEGGPAEVSFHVLPDAPELPTHEPVFISGASQTPDNVYTLSCMMDERDSFLFCFQGAVCF